MTGTKERCPACGGDQRLTEHCPSNTACTWRVCVNPACRVIVDTRSFRHSHQGAKPGPCRVCDTTA